MESSHFFFFLDRAIKHTAYSPYGHSIEYIVKLEGGFHNTANHTTCMLTNLIVSDYVFRIWGNPRKICTFARSIPPPSLINCIQTSKAIKSYERHSLHRLNKHPKRMSM